MNRLRCSCRVMPVLRRRAPYRSLAHSADGLHLSGHAADLRAKCVRSDQENAMVEVRPVGGALGADIIGVDLSRPLTSAEFGAIHGGWMAHLVLRFREQRLTDDALMAFSRNFGALDGNPRHAKAEGRPEANANAGFVNVISNVVENGR